MPTRSRNAAAAPVETTEAEVTETALHTLQFNEPLSWRVSKPIAIGELHRRLSALAEELKDMEQEENDRDSLTKVAKELAGHNLLAHKDKGVRAWTACCLVEILRLCAPDAPYTGAQLKVTRQNRCLCDVTDGLALGYLYSDHYVYPPGAVRSLQCVQ